MNIKRLDKKQQNQYPINTKEFFEFNDISGLPKGIRAAMSPLREHILRVVTDTIKDTLTYVESPIDGNKADILMRLQKLHRLLSHMEGKTDADLHSISTSDIHSEGKVLDGPIEVRGMADRGTVKRLEDSVLARLEHARSSKGKVLQP